MIMIAINYTLSYCSICVCMSKCLEINAVLLVTRSSSIFYENG